MGEAVKVNCALGLRYLVDTRRAQPKPSEFFASRNPYPKPHYLGMSCPSPSHHTARAVRAVHLSMSRWVGAVEKVENHIKRKFVQMMLRAMLAI